MATREERVAAGSRRKRDLAAVGADPVARSRQRFERAREWAVANVPDQHPDFAAAAFLTLRFARIDKPTAEEVRDRLKSQKRDRASLDALERS